MKNTEHDIYAYQLTNELVQTFHYQLIKIQQIEDDIWLFNPDHIYPVIRITNKTNSSSLQAMDYLEYIREALSKQIGKDTPILILNINEHAIAFQHEHFIQMVIKVGEENKEVDAIFPDLSKKIFNVDKPEALMPILQQSIIHSQQIQQQQMMQKVRAQLKVPKLTMILIGIMIAWYVLAFTLTGLTADPAVGAVLSGAYYKMNIVAASEYWRFLTSGFVNIDMFQMLINVMILVNLGRMCEKAFTKFQYITIFLTSIIVGNIFVFIGNGNMIISGPSAGFFGILSAYITTMILKHEIQTPLVKKNIANITIVVLIGFIGTFLPWMAIGGVITGIICALLFNQNKELKALKINTLIATLIFVIGGGYLFSKSLFVEPRDYELDHAIVTSTKGTSFDFYGQYLEDSYQKIYEGKK